MTDIFLYQDNFKRYQDVESVLQYGDFSACPNPVFSVIMPVYGNPKYFIYSLNSVINQDADFLYEVIIVDNTPLNSQKSQVLRKIEELNLKNIFYYRNKENIGMTGNWNRGIQLSRSELITFCHDDDMLYPNCLSTLWDMHNKYKNKFIIPLNVIVNEKATKPMEIISGHNLKGKEVVKLGKIDIFMGNPANGVGCLFYKKHLLEIGGYNDEYYPSADNALHIKYFFDYGAILCKKVLYCYRVTSDNTSNKVYKLFILNGLSYCRFILKRLGIPNIVGKIFIHAYFTKNKELAKNLWEKNNKIQIKQTKWDKILFRLLRYRNLLKNIY